VVPVIEKEWLFLSGSRAREREAYKGEREKMGRKKERVGPVTVINWDPHEFSPDLNLDWIQK
jgi:hypothetical protein